MGIVSIYRVVFDSIEFVTNTCAGYDDGGTRIQMQGNCNTLQHTATHCNTLHHTATHRHTLHHRTHCNTCNALQHTATHYNTLQYSKNTLQHSATRILMLVNGMYIYISLTHAFLRHKFTTHCNTLQHTATPCNTLQHPATHCTKCVLTP